MPVLVINENGIVRIENLEKAVTKIGREKGNDIHIDSMEISRFHCQIQRLEEGYLITDLNSRNGTIVNGSYVRGVFLEDGDMVHIGDISLIFKLEGSDQTSGEDLESHQFKVIAEEKLKELKLLALEREHLLRLQDISIHIASLLDMDRLLDVVLENVLDLTGADRGFIMLLDEKNRLNPRAERNMVYKKAHPHEKKLAKELIQKAFKERKMVSVRDNLPMETNPQSRKTVSMALSSVIVIPLKSMAWKARQKEESERRNMTSPFASQLLGIIYLASRQEIKPFSSQDMDLIEAISHHVAMGITNAKLHEMATTDKLTNLYNRGYFETMLTDEIRKAEQTGSPLSLVMTDIDHFKKFNDTYGHQIGDQVLRDVARVIKTSLRQDDIPARYGGEELVFILPKTNAEQACIVAEKVRNAIEKSKHTDKELQVTISLGAASYPDQAKSGDMLVKRADQALYKAKDEGRNCWRLWKEEYESEGVGERTDKLAGIVSGDQARNYRNTQLLLDTIAILNSDTDLDNLLERLLDKILEITHADRTLIFLTDVYGVLEFKKGRAKGEKTLEQVSMYSRSIPQRVFEEGKPCCMIDDGTDTSGDPAMTASQSMGRFQLQTVMCVPLQAQGKRFGVVYVDSHIAKQEFTETDLILLEALANQVSTALYHTQMLDEKLNEEIEKRKALEAELLKIKKMG